MSGRGEEGIALIAVLWTLILLSIIVAAVSLETRTSARIAHNTVENATVRSAADAGIQRAILDLLASPDVSGENGRFHADGTVYAWPFANSTVRISVQDERGKINLNEATEQVLIALFRSVGVDPDKAQSLAAAIADFRDADNLMRPGGAEEAEYQAAGLPWGPKNAPFEAVEELKQVLGVTPEIYQQVFPDLTIYSASNAINPALAGEGLTGILIQAGINNSQYLRSPERAYSIRAQASDSNGAVFVREAVVQVFAESPIPVVVLSWGARANSYADAFTRDARQ
jgi:general secretion pathway protein K